MTRLKSQQSWVAALALLARNDECLYTTEVLGSGANAAQVVSQYLPKPPTAALN